MSTKQSNLLTKSIKNAEQFFLEATLQDLATTTGVQACRWSLYFRHKKQVSEPTLQKLASALNITKSKAFELIEIRRNHPIDNRKTNR
jgi:transcriptional regulator with XRE-family HTH domain